MLSYIEMDAQKNLALAPYTGYIWIRYFFIRTDFNTMYTTLQSNFKLILFLFSHKVNSRANSYTLKLSSSLRYSLRTYYYGRLA